MRLRIRVLDGDSLQALAGARLEFRSLQAVRQQIYDLSLTEGFLDPGPEDWFALSLTRGRGQSARCDARGEYIVNYDRKEEGGLVILADDSGRRGGLIVKEHGDSDSAVLMSVDLLVYAKSDVSVQILDSYRRPAAGVPFNVHLLRAADRQAYDAPSLKLGEARGKSCAPVGHIVSDARGILTLPCLRNLSACFAADEGRAQAEPDFVLLPAIPLRSFSDFRLGLRDAPKQFVLAPAGRLELELRRSDGTALELAARAALSARADGDLIHGTLRFERTAALSATKRFGVPQRMLFPWVALHVPLELEYELFPQGLGFSADLPAISDARAVNRRRLRFDPGCVFFHAAISPHLALPLPEQLHVQLANSLRKYLDTRLEIGSDAQLRFAAYIGDATIFGCKLSYWDRQKRQRVSLAEKLSLSPGRSYELGMLKLGAK